MIWKKVKLEEVLKQRKGFNEIDNEIEYKLCRVKVHKKGVVLRELLKGYQIRTKKQQVCKAGDFIVAEMDAKFGGYGFVPEELDGAIVSSHYFLFELNIKKIRPQYLEVVSQLNILQEQIKAVGSTNYAAIRPSNVLSWEIPLPPIEKQIEIEKIFELAKTNTEKLKSLSQFQLTQIENLNQAILQEAVQGKLVAQNKDDEPASELLKRVKAEKEKLGKKEKPLPVIKPEEIPFEIPESWVWCRLGEIINMSRGKFSIRPRNDQSCFGGVYPFIQIGSLDMYGSIINEFSQTLNEKGLKASKIFPKGTIVIAIVGGTIGNLGVLGIKMCFPDSIIGIFPSEHYNQEFILNYLRYKQSDIKRLAYQMSGQPNIKIPTLENLFISLPPLSEQNRIVAEIEKQLAKTKQLKEHVIANQQATEQLLKALLHQAFEVEEDKKEKVEQPTAKVIEYQPSRVNYNELYAEPAAIYAKTPTTVTNNQLTADVEAAIIVAQIEKRFGLNYGEVAMQKTFFNLSAFNLGLIRRYFFKNSNFGTYSPKLKADLKANPFLSKTAKGKGDTFGIKPIYKKEIAEAIANPANKVFINAVNDMLRIYSLSFINKETDKIELLNTVTKMMIDLKTIDLTAIYDGMKNWPIKQDGFKTKAAKFSELDTKTMIELMQKNGLVERLF